MNRIGIFFNPQSETAARSAAELEEWLHQHNLLTWCSSLADATAREQLAGSDLLICLGGDGTALRGAGIAIPQRIPLLPIALGHLSFMAEVTPGAMYQALERVLSGDYWVEERALAEAWIYCAEAEPERVLSLNETLIGRGDIARVIAVAVRVDGIPMTTYYADGVLVATATGSTAYALAAGGPVLDPRSQALVLVPVAAHLHNVPSLVLHENAHLELEVANWYPAALSIDGRVSRPLQFGDRVTVRRAPEVARFVRVQSPSYFYQTLTRRLRRDEPE